MEFLAYMRFIMMIEGGLRGTRKIRFLRGKIKSIKVYVASVAFVGGLSGLEPRTKLPA